MLGKILGDPGQAVAIDSRISITAIVFLAVVGPCVFILQPGFVQGLVEYVGLSEAEAGYVASAEMFGLAATTILLNFISSRFDWRRMIALFIAITVIGNLASVGLTELKALAAVRFFTGLGSGGIISLTFVMMGLTHNPDRNFGLIIVWLLLYGGLGLLAMPSVYQAVGMDGLLIFFALFCAAGFYFVRYLPVSAADHVAESADSVSYSMGLKVPALLGILAYNIAIGLVWAYLFLVGLKAGMGEQAVANGLTLSQFLGCAGAFVAVVLGTRIGRAIPMMVSILGGAFGIYLLLGEIGAMTFVIGVGLFNFLWNSAMPYLLATLASFDASGKVIVCGVSGQFLGYAIGPAIGGMIVGDGNFDLVNGIAVGLFVLSGLLLLPGVLAQREGLSDRAGPAGARAD